MNRIGWASIEDKRKAGRLNPAIFISFTPHCNAQLIRLNIIHGIT